MMYQMVLLLVRSSILLLLDSQFFLSQFITGGEFASRIESPDEAHDVPDGAAALSARAEGEAAADEGGDAAGHENTSAAEAAAEGSVEEAPGEKGDKAGVDIKHVGG